MVRPFEKNAWKEDAESLFLFHIFAWGPIFGPIILFASLGMAQIIRRSPEERAATKRLMAGLKAALNELQEKLNTQE